MSVNIRKHPRGGWDVDIRVPLATGKRHRERRKLSASYSKTTAREWAERRERELLLSGPRTRKEVPTLEAFAPRFVDGYARANRQKPSGIAAKEMILRVHLVPVLGHKRLDTITSEDVQQLKSRLRTKAAKTVNNILTVLNVLMKKAVEWDVIDQMPRAITLLPVPKGATAFHDFDEYERLVAAAKATDLVTSLIVLLGGEAGLRCGEMIALEWRDVDLGTRQLSIQRSDWNGHVTMPKGGRLRYVPLTLRLLGPLRDHRHLCSARVLCQEDGRPLTRPTVQYRARRVSRRAKLTEDGVHILRHTFCSHLAMRGAPIKAIQELAGPRELSMTQRYMHLSPATLESAIRLLDPPAVVPGRGDNWETARVSEGKANG